jgi:hypothetical protein
MPGPDASLRRTHPRRAKITPFVVDRIRRADAGVSYTGDGSNGGGAYARARVSLRFIFSRYILARLTARTFRTTSADSGGFRSFTLQERTLPFLCEGSRSVSTTTNKKEDP